MEVTLSANDHRSDLSISKGLLLDESGWEKSGQWPSGGFCCAVQWGASGATTRPLVPAARMGGR